MYTVRVSTEKGPADPQVVRRKSKTMLTPEKAEHRRVEKKEKCDKPKKKREEHLSSVLTQAVPSNVS